MGKKKTKKEQLIKIKTVDSLQGGGLIKEIVQGWKDDFLLRGAPATKIKKDETKHLSR